MPVQENKTKKTKKASSHQKPTSAKKATQKKAGKEKAGQKKTSTGKVTVRQPHVAELYEFTTNFFALFACKTKRLDRRKYGPLLITLAPELVAYFGTETLNLAFHQVEPIQGQALVAHGSPIFDKMLGYLDRKSAVALQQLPVRHGAGEELLRAVQPTNAGIVNLRTEQGTQQILAFHWRITYRADDKREELYTVMLDSEGQRIPTPTEADSLQTNQIPPQITPMAIETLLADAEAPVAEANADGQLMPPKLPPMTHLVPFAEAARKYAIYHADVRCVSHEAEILPRLYKTLNRLSTYYQQQIEEVYDSHDPSGEKRRALEIDLERKLAEEVENHRLRVQLQLVSYVIFQMPVATAQMTLSDGKQDLVVTIERNRYSGELRRPTCHACNQAIKKLAIDRNGHIICDGCVQQCAGCQDVLCTQCGVEPCPTCGQANCDSCGHLCWACGERACAEHISTCPTCDDAVCHGCQSACDQCGTRQCRSHLRLDHVRSQGGKSVLVCNDCAIRCPGCNQYSVEAGSCEKSGQQFCQRCLVDCVACGKRVGPGFYEQFGEQIYCHSCLHECPSCGNWAQAIEACPTCGEGYCAQCGQGCAVCGTIHCIDHSHYFGACEHTICHHHLVHCTGCHNELCPECSEACAICGGHHCDGHTTRCGSCGQRYCQACVAEGGICTTCATIDPERDAIDLHAEPCAAEPRIEPLLAEYTWARGTNTHYKVYLGQNALSQRALIVMAYDENGETIVSLKGKGLATAKGKAKAKKNSGSSTSTTDDEKDPNEWLNEFQDWLRRMRRRQRR